MLVLNLIIHILFFNLPRLFTMTLKKHVTVILMSSLFYLSLPLLMNYDYNNICYSH